MEEYNLSYVSEHRPARQTESLLGRRRRIKFILARQRHQGGLVEGTVKRSLGLLASLEGFSSFLPLLFFLAFIQCEGPTCHIADSLLSYSHIHADVDSPDASTGTVTMAKHGVLAAKRTPWAIVHRSEQLQASLRTERKLNLFDGK